jgi:hypothetical protein
MYLAGAHLKRFYPLGLVMDGVGLNVSGFRYCDELWVTIVSCRKMLPDPQRFGQALSANLRALADAVDAGRRPHLLASSSIVAPPSKSTSKERRPTAGSSTERVTRTRKRAPGLPLGTFREGTDPSGANRLLEVPADPATRGSQKTPDARQH